MTSVVVANDFGGHWTTVFSVFSIPDVGRSMLRAVSHCRGEREMTGGYRSAWRKSDLKEPGLKEEYYEWKLSSQEFILWVISLSWISVPSCPLCSSLPIARTSCQSPTKSERLRLMAGAFSNSEEGTQPRSGPTASFTPT